MLSDLRKGAQAPTVSARFHNGVARLIRDICVMARQQTGLDVVALSGGVFQNATLLRKTLPLLRGAGFTVYTHELVPPNDGGLALGQAAIAACSFGISDQGV